MAGRTLAQIHKDLHRSHLEVARTIAKNERAAAFRFLARAAESRAYFVRAKASSI